jgi:hypothetical protein
MASTEATRRKTIFAYVYMEKIGLYDSGEHRSHKKENHFCICFNGKIGLYDSGEQCGPWASCLYRPFKFVAIRST